MYKMVLRGNLKKEFWLINKSVDRDVSLADLRITIKKGSRINLLSKHYCFTQEQINASVNSGSIYNKRHILCVREIEPRNIKSNYIKEVVKPRLLKPLRNPQAQILPPYIEELNVDDNWLSMSDEQFAAEYADTDSMDRKPVLAVDKKFEPSKDLETLIEE